jgi:L-ascorbate metabolism protein UlaG (beta-lactamase superfamily)
MAIAGQALGQKIFEKDTIQTTGGPLVITFVGHGSLWFNFQSRNIYVDPVSQVADLTGFPKADAILITHDHGDHLDPEAIKKLSKEGTEVFITKLCQAKIPSGKVFGNGEFLIAAGVPVEVVPAYNIISMRGNGRPYHPKGDGNGYVFKFGQFLLYVAGDTELIPEMMKLTDISILFLPIAEPYTMPLNMAAETARQIKPKILYPYHFNNSNPDDLKKMLMDTDIDVRIRSMK